MSLPLIRFSRRLASWSPETDEGDLLKAEFRMKDGGPDLRPSVYEIPPDRVVQAYAEHATMMDPPNSTLGVDLGGLGREVAKNPGLGGFVFTREAHREVVLRDQDDLRRLVRQVREDLGKRSREVRREEIVTYAKGRLAVGDGEWAAAATRPTAKKWLAKLVQPNPPALHPKPAANNQTSPQARGRGRAVSVFLVLVILVFLAILWWS